MKGLDDVRTVIGEENTTGVVLEDTILNKSIQENNFIQTSKGYVDMDNIGRDIEELIISDVLKSNEIIPNSEHIAKNGEIEPGNDDILKNKEDDNVQTNENNFDEIERKSESTISNEASKNDKFVTIHDELNRDGLNGMSTSKRNSKNTSNSLNDVSTYNDMKGNVADHMNGQSDKKNEMVSQNEEITIDNLNEDILDSVENNNSGIIIDYGNKVNGLEATAENNIIYTATLEEKESLERYVQGLIEQVSNSKEPFDKANKIIDFDTQKETVVNKFDEDNCLIFLWDPLGVSFGKNAESTNSPLVICFNSTNKFEEFFLKTIDKIGIGSHRFTISGVQINNNVNKDQLQDMMMATKEKNSAINKEVKRKKRRISLSCSTACDNRLATAYVYPGGGKAILWPTISIRRSKLNSLQWSAAWCVSILVMTRLIKVSVLSWDSEIMDDASAIALEIRDESVFREGKKSKNILLPEQVVNVFNIDNKCVHFDLQLVATTDMVCEKSYQEFRVMLEQSLYREASLTMIWSSISGCSAAFSCHSKNTCFLAAHCPSPCILSYSTPENLVIGYFSMAAGYPNTPHDIMLFHMDLSIC